MRETFRARACERVDSGFLITVEFMRRKVAWNAEDFWIYDPIHTLALAGEFGFVGENTLRTNEEHLCGSWSRKSKNKGVHDGADVLDERETRQCRSLIDTVLNDGKDRPETQYTTGESARVHV